MEIGKVIRKYRQEKGLTQEQLAGMIGISAPAVNKWENGNSYPDIALLAPIARALDIDMDTLFAFRKELTEKDVGVMVQKLSDMMSRGEFEQAFSQAKNWMEEYPGSELLALNLAVSIYGGMLMYQAEETEECRESIRKWLELAAESKEQRIRDAALPFLVVECERRKEYEKAQKLLDGVPDHSFDKHLMQAMLYRTQNETEKAYICLEKYLQYLKANIECVLQQLTVCACREKDYETAGKYAAVYRGLAEIMGLPRYNYHILDFMVASETRDKEAGLTAMEQMLEGIERPRNMKEDLLCRHLDLPEGAGTFNERMKDVLRKSFTDAEEYAFLREDERFWLLVERLG